MPPPTFHDWLESRSDEAPAADRLATLIAGAGATGVSRTALAKAVCLPPETLQDLLKALVATGQVMVLKVNGERVYCMALGSVNVKVVPRGSWLINPTLPRRYRSPRSLML